MNYNDFIDLNCESEGCGACEIDKTPVFVMRGLCKDSNFDYHYGWTGELSNGEKYNFRGFSNSFLYWDDENQYWKIEQNSNPSIYAISNNTVGPYPIGTNKWYFFNDNIACINSRNKILENVYVEDINLSSCNSNQFNCHDGTW